MLKPQGGNPAEQNALQDASTCSAPEPHVHLPNTATQARFASAMSRQAHHAFWIDQTADEGPCLQRSTICNPHGRWAARPPAASQPLSSAAAVDSMSLLVLGINPYAEYQGGQHAKDFAEATEETSHLVEQSCDLCQQCTIACGFVADSPQCPMSRCADATWVLGSATRSAILHNS